MNKRAWGWLVLATGVVIAVSCSDDETGGEQVCTPGLTQPCLGPGQCDGAQRCNADGSGWDACECGAGGGGGATGGTGGAPGGTGGAAAQGGVGGQGGNGGAVVGGGTPTGGGGSSTGGGSSAGGGTPTGGNPCAGVVNISHGETAACNTCVENNCCDDYITCANGTTASDCDALFDCGSTAPCFAECFYPICGSDVGYTFYQDCRDCIDLNCCNEFNACIGDVDCMNCLTEINVPSSCDATTLDDDYDNCMSTHCPFADCPQRGGAGGGGG